MLTNYHTHHFRCRHAKGTVEDYIKEAVRHNFDEIGMSCHLPFENFPELKAVRMTYDEMPLYFADIEDAQKKYPQLSILKSMECEYFPRFHDYLKRIHDQCDYLVLGQHYIFNNGIIQDAFRFIEPTQLRIYAEKVVEALETGLFRILAHPDVFMTKYPKWDSVCQEISRQIIESAIKNDVILEINANGYRKGKRKYEDGTRYGYPSENFWHLLAQEFPQAKVMINSDCHNPEFLNDEFMDKARDFAKRLNLNVVEKL
ncbi:MAG: histidinol-phosphatase [Turicibacter sp.]|nr:histidinol-phosphatase [Turicibacter sp.]